MSAVPFGARRALLGFAWVALFSILYTAGESLGLWPQMRPGALRDLDLVAGAMGVAAFCVMLLWSRASRGAGRQEGSRPSEASGS